MAQPEIGIGIMDIKVEVGFLPSKSGPSYKESSDLIPTIQKVKTEFIPDVEDEVSDTSNPRNCYQVVENNTRKIRTESMNVWPEDKDINFYTSIDSFTRVVMKKQDIVEEKEEVEQASNASYLVTLSESNENFGNNDKLFQMEMMHKETEETCTSGSDLLTNSVRTSLCLSEISMMDIAKSYQSDGSFEIICSNEEQAYGNNLFPSESSSSLENDLSAETSVVFKVGGKAKCQLDVNFNMELWQPTVASRKKRCSNKDSATCLQKKELPCTQCTSSFDYKSQLIQHSVAVHTTEKPFSCPHCFATFNNKGNLKRHFVLHTTKKPFSCPHCTSKFKAQRELKSHIASHSSNKPYECLQCGVKFKNNHMKLFIQMSDPLLVKTVL